jgi:hypothetical protein
MVTRHKATVTTSTSNARRPKHKDNRRRCVKKKRRVHQRRKSTRKHVKKLKKPLLEVDVSQLDAYREFWVEKHGLYRWLFFFFF